MRVRLAIVAASLAILIAAACQGAGGLGATVTSTPATVVPSTANATTIPTPTSTPAVQVPGQRIASTAALPRAALPQAQFLRGGTLLGSLPIEVPPPTEYEVGESGRLGL